MLSTSMNSFLSLSLSSFKKKNMNREVFVQIHFTPFACVGPECSSLGYSAMEEIGPFRVNADGETLVNCVVKDFSYKPLRKRNGLMD